MVIKIRININPVNRINLPFFTGYIVRGLVLFMLRKINPSISQDLHELNIVKPYSVTPIFFNSFKKRDNGYELDQKNHCFFEVRFLEDNLANPMIEFITSHDTIMIFDREFKIESVHIKSDDLSQTTNSNFFKIIFDTPTHLSKIGSKFDTLFPEPLIIFSNLMRIWDSCMPQKFGKEIYSEYKKWLGNNVVISGYDLHTTKIFEKIMKIGFTGWCSYRIIDLDSKFCNYTRQLIKFAKYSNVGMERTAGFGVIRYIEAKY